MARILIADTDPAFRKALILLLSHRMAIHAICEAADIGALIQILVKDPPDVLLLGWSLYGTSGPATCQLLQKSHPSLKVVLLSVNPEDAAEAKAAGAAFLQKGIPAEEILASLRTILTE